LAARPLLAFVVLAFVLSWAVWVPAGLMAPDAGMSVYMMGAFGPAVAAAVMVRAGGGSVRAWIRDMAVFRVGLRWYLAALALTLVQPVVVTVVAVAAGLPLAFGELPMRVPAFLAGLVVVLLVGGGQEEPGWRGYMLPRLQARMNPLAASVVVGVVWAVWHLPLFILGFADYGDRSFLLNLPILVGFAVVLTWLYNATHGSVVLAMLLHAGFNASNALVAVPRTAEFEPGLEVLAQAALAVAMLVLAAVLVAVYGTRLRARPLDAEVTDGNVADSAATAQPETGERRDAATADRGDNVASRVGGKR
jgi:membrane protease YdiL (CAAX protease family)